MSEIKLYSRSSKDGAKLYIEYYDNSHRRVRKSLNLLDTKSNVAYVKRTIIPEIERKINYGLEARKYKLSEFTNSVLDFAKEESKLNTFKTYSFAIKKFFDIMGDVYVEDITIMGVEKYIQILKKNGLSTATINLYISPISQAFNDAIRMGIILQNPVTFAKKPKVRNKQYQVFNLLQVKTLLDLSEGALKKYLYFAFFLGARPNEILALRWKHIGDTKIKIEKTKVSGSRGVENSPKGGNVRRISILKPLKDYLSSLPCYNKNDYVFDVSYDYIKDAYYDLLVSLGYEKRVLHTIRHTFTSLLYQAKENPTMIKEFLGHSSMAMINKIYAHYTEDENDLSRTESFFE